MRFNCFKCGRIAMQKRLKHVKKREMIVLRDFLQYHTFDIEDSLKL